MSHRLARFTVASIIGASSFAVAPAAFADDNNNGANSSSSNVINQISEPSSNSQNSSNARSEAAVDRTSADPATNMNDVKARGAAAIAQRQNTLTEIAGKLSTAKKDCGSNAAMLAELQKTSTGLSAVGVSLASATDLTSAKTLYRSIFIDYRVYAVVGPKANKVLRCDTQLYRNELLAAEGLRVQGLIDAAKARGVNTAGPQATKDAAMAMLAGINPVPALAPVMGLQPDHGDRAVMAANAAAFSAADLALDTTFAAQRRVNEQFDVVRRALRDNNRDNNRDLRENEKAQKRAERDAEKAKREAERAAEKAKREAERNARKANRGNGEGNGHDD